MPAPRSHLHPPSPKGRAATCAPLARSTRRFPGDPRGLGLSRHAATAQKPQPVIDAITRGYAETYATVHRGVYQRSADMTLAFEAARRRVAALHRRRRGRGDRLRPRRDRGDQPRRAKLGRRQSEARRPDPALDARASSNIVPWQLSPSAARDRRRAADRRPPHRPRRDGGDDHGPSTSWSRSRHVSNVLGSVLDAQARRRHRAFGRREDPARRLPGGAAHAGRRRRARLRLLRLLGPQALRPDRDRRALGAGRDLLDAMPPWQGGGAMIDRVTFEKTTYAPPPARFEAGTPHVVGVIGLACRDRLCRGDRPRRASHAHEAALVARDARRAAAAQFGAPVRPRGQRRHRQLRGRGGASARHRHHIGRGAGGDPGRASLRPAADGRISACDGDGAGELRGL